MNVSKSIIDNVTISNNQLNFVNFSDVRDNVNNQQISYQLFYMCIFIPIAK